MNGYILIFICLFLIKQELSAPTLPLSNPTPPFSQDPTIPPTPYPSSSSTNTIYLPMKKDHKYGDDICYYREMDEKLNYAVYYVKPCEKGKYCEQGISFHPFGFCRDIPTNVTSFPYYGESCTSNGECETNLKCEGGTCKLECTGTYNNHQNIPFQHLFNTFYCEHYDYKTIESQYCEWTDYDFNNVYPQRYLHTYQSYVGSFPGLPKECGKINYVGFSDFEPVYSSSTGETTYKPFTRYLLQSKEWCSIGEAKDGDFVENWRFCKSGFTLKFFPNGDLIDPSNSAYGESTKDMCVTPIEIDNKNALVGCVITYKGKDGTEHKYNAAKYGVTCNEDEVIKSKLYTEFIEEFNNAIDEDKKNCYGIPQGYTGNCENIKLLKLAYFYNHIEDYLFYKDRKDLEKVLHYKIQQTYHRYYESSTYLNLNYLFFLLILILL